MKNSGYKSVKQLDITDCGAACLASVSAFYGHTRPVSLIRAEAGTDMNGTSLLGLVRAAEKIGFIASPVKVPEKVMINDDLPAIAHLNIKKMWFHFVVIYSVDEENYTIMDPAKGKIEKVKREEFNQEWTSVLLILKPGKNFTQEKNYIPVYKRIIDIVSPHKTELIKVMAGAILYSGLGITTALYIEILTDRIIPEGNISHLNLISLILVFFILVRIMVGFLKNLILIKTGQKIDSRLIHDYNRHILELPLSFFQSMKTGEILTRISDAIKIRSFINSVVQEISVNILIVFITLTIMFFYSPLLCLLVLSSVPFYLILYKFLNRTNKKFLRKTMELSAEMESQMVETVKGINIIKAFNTEKSHNLKLSNIIKDLLGTIFKTSKDYTITSSGSELISTVWLLASLWSGAYLIISGKMTYGELFSFYSLYAYLSAPLMNLILSNRGIQDAKIATERLFQIMDLPTENNITEKKIWNGNDKIHLIVKNLSFGFPGKLELLEDISFSCKPGTITAIVGESGSGKSTLIALMLKFFLPSEGEIIFNTRSCKDLSTSEIRSSISYVPQVVKLFSGTLGENICLQDSMYDPGEMEYCLKATALDQLIKKLPQGIDTHISEDGNNFSGGEKQKIALARALYKNSPLVILDEPSSSMDIHSEKKLLALLNELKKEGKTIIIAAHKLSMIQYADQIMVLKNGKITESGLHSVLINSNGNYSQLWNYQKNEDLCS